jgi:hypothetical protein
MKPYAAAILALATSAGCKSEVGGVPCIADSICQPLCASDPDCAPSLTSGPKAGATKGPLLCGRYVVADPGNGGVRSGTGIVVDTRTGLHWSRFMGPELDGYFQQAAYCQSKGMRLPTRAEALGIAGDELREGPPQRNDCKQAWPEVWLTFTTDMDEATGMVWHVIHNGSAGLNSLDLRIGNALCVKP